MRKVDLSYFYVLTDPSLKLNISWWWPGISRRFDEQLGGEAWNHLWAGTLAPIVPIPLKLLKGREKPDVIDGDLPVRFYSGRLVRWLHEAGCGDCFRTFPVVMYDRADESVIDEDVVWVPRLQVGAGPIDESRGAPLLISGHCLKDPLLRDAVGLFFDPSTWSGLNMFRLPNHSAVIVTSPVASSLLARGSVGMDVIPVADFGRELRDSRVRRLKERFPDGVPPAGPMLES